MKLYNKSLWLSLRLTFLILASGLTSFAQFIPKDELPNLWIITIDKSCSMLHDQNGDYYEANRNYLAREVVKRFRKNQIIQKSIDFKKDNVIFFSSGLLTKDNILFNGKLDYSALNSGGEFTEEFIHNTDGSLLNQYKNEEEFYNALERSILRGMAFKFKTSFVSLIRLYSLKKAIKNIYNIDSAYIFNKIYILTITDDADQNDQWSIDRRTLRKYANKKLVEIDNDLNKFIHNPFNQKSEVKGFFNEICYDNASLPFIYVYEYNTYQSLADTVSNINLLDLASISNKNFKITIKSKNEIWNSLANNNYSNNGDSSNLHIQFLHINNLSSARSITTILTNNFTTESLIKFDKLFFPKKVKINGYIQIQYGDDLIGPRTKQIFFTQSAVVKSKTFSFIFLIILLLIISGILAFIVNKIIIKPNQNILEIFCLDNPNNTEFKILNIRIKNKYLEKKINKTLLVYSNNSNIIDKDYGVVITRDQNLISRRLKRIDSNINLELLIEELKGHKISNNQPNYIFYLFHKKNNFDSQLHDGYNNIIPKNKYLAYFKKNLDLQSVQSYSVNEDELLNKIKNTNFNISKVNIKKNCSLDKCNLYLIYNNEQGNIILSFKNDSYLRNEKITNNILNSIHFYNTEIRNKCSLILFDFSESNHVKMDILKPALNDPSLFYHQFSFKYKCLGLPIKFSNNSSILSQLLKSEKQLKNYHIIVIGLTKNFEKDFKEHFSTKRISFIAEKNQAVESLYKIKLNSYPNYLFAVEYTNMLNFKDVRKTLIYNPFNHKEVEEFIEVEKFKEFKTFQLWESILPIFTNNLLELNAFNKIGKNESLIRIADSEEQLKLTFSKGSSTSSENTEIILNDYSIKSNY